MPTAAYSSYGTQVRMSDGVSFGSYPIIAATQTSPIIITTGVVHNIIDVSYGTITGVLPANQGANGSWLLERVSATQLKLHNAAGIAAYGSGGTLTPSGTFAAIAELRDAQDAGAETTVVDVSSHDGNGYSSELPLLKRTKRMRLDINLVPGHPTHDEVTGLLSLFNSSARRDWLLVLPPYAPLSNYKVAYHVFGAVQYYTVPFAVDQALQMQVTLAFDGKMTQTVG